VKGEVEPKKYRRSMIMITERKSKSLQSIEDKMQDLDESSLRYKVLESAKDFKLSWISLGRYLYSVSNDKAYKEWGYMTFEAYCAKEIGVKKQTAVKLLRSYYFLESEEPQVLKMEQSSTSEAVNKLPSYEAVNLLRLAKVNKKLDKTDYDTLREDVLEKGKDTKEVKKELYSMVRPDQDMGQDKQKRKVSTMRRMVSLLETLKQQMKDEDMLSKPLLAETERLIAKLKDSMVTS